MQQPIKRLGELLVEGGLITPAQLQSAITHQKIARGRLGSNLVALGYISEEVLMDFLSHQTGVPQMDVRNIEVPPQVLKLVPHRLADQFTVLPIATQEPKSRGSGWARCATRVASSWASAPSRCLAITSPAPAM